jgi:hypothetical protein
MRVSMTTEVEDRAMARASREPSSQLETVDVASTSKNVTTKRLTTKRNPPVTVSLYRTRVVFVALEPNSGTYEAELEGNVEGAIAFAPSPDKLRFAVDTGRLWGYECGEKKADGTSVSKGE